MKHSGIGEFRSRKACCMRQAASARRAPSPLSYKFKEGNHGRHAVTGPSGKASYAGNSRRDVFMRDKIF